MTDLVLASTEADASAAAAVEQHHAQLSGALALHVEALVSAASRGNPPTALLARDRLVRWAREELLPHAAAEERVLYPAARAIDGFDVLIDAMTGEHAALARLVDEAATTADVARAVIAGSGLRALFESHLAKENELILPRLCSSAEVSLADLLARMEEQLVAAAPVAAEPAGRAGHTCGCGEHDGPGYPELDARAVPHAIRHATIFGALGSVRPGGGLQLLAPHDPLPLLAQIEERWPETFEVGYTERGPEVWRLVFVRTGN